MGVNTSHHTGKLSIDQSLSFDTKLAPLIYILRLISFESDTFLNLSAPNFTAFSAADSDNIQHQTSTIIRAKRVVPLDEGEEYYHEDRDDEAEEGEEEEDVPRAKKRRMGQNQQQKRDNKFATGAQQAGAIHRRRAPMVGQGVRVKRC